MGATSCHIRGRTTEAASAVYVRADTDHTTVVSPYVRAAAVVGDRVGIEASETIDAWTGASVDVVTAATRAIHERRYETTATTSYAGDLWTFAGSYRYSTEPDYRSQGGSLRMTADLAQRNTTLAMTVFGSNDTVGRAGDPGFRRALMNGGARLTLTQVLDPSTLGEVQWETVQVAGYQASPYRFVAVGGSGVCAEGAPFCLPEEIPDVRTRHAPALRLRRALGARVSFGLDYRMYFDSWDLWSHTVEPDLAWLIGDRTTVAATYRYYTQSDASFYRPRYFAFDGGSGWFTRDRKLSAFFSHGLGVSVRHDFPVGKGGSGLSMGARGTFTHFRYLAFVGLREVSAVETTLFLSLRFD
ncbi:MAG: DUF3570 domain-containing protein [Bacteroidota bacterium]